VAHVAALCRALAQLQMGRTGMRTRMQRARPAPCARACRAEGTKQCTICEKQLLTVGSGNSLPHIVHCLVPSARHARAHGAGWPRCVRVLVPGRRSAADQAPDYVATMATAISEYLSSVPADNHRGGAGAGSQLQPVLLVACPALCVPHIPTWAAASSCHSPNTARAPLRGTHGASVSSLGCSLAPSQSTCAERAASPGTWASPAAEATAPASAVLRGPLAGKPVSGRCTPMLAKQVPRALRSTHRVSDALGAAGQPGEGPGAGESACAAQVSCRRAGLQRARKRSRRACCAGATQNCMLCRMPKLPPWI